MNATFQQICALVKDRKVRLSAHSFARLDKRGILVGDIVAGVQNGEVLEDYPEAFIGPSVLVLQANRDGELLHVVWGIEKDTTEPAVIVTAYYPDPALWSADFRSRN
jgi:Domain of unknown function (DUF4258)